MKSDPSAACFVQHLENPNLNGIPLGLEWPENAEVRLKEDMFGCCAGTGLHLTPGDGPMESKNAYYTPCSIKKRLKGVKRLMGTYVKNWGTPSLPPLAASHDPQILEKAANLIKGYGPQAVIVPGTSNPGLVWWMALALVWRFGHRVEVFSFARKGTSNHVDASLKSLDEPVVVIIESWRRLSDLQELSSIEALIHYVYSTNSFLIFEYVPQDQQVRNKGQIRPGSMAARKLYKYRQYVQEANAGKSPLGVLGDHLEEDTYSQLYSMCHLPRMLSNQSDSHLF